MQIQGICWIANKYQSTESSFNKKEGSYNKLRAEGVIKWSDKKKNKDGSESRTYINKKFTCFDANVIDILESCKKDLLVIEGRLIKVEYLNKDNKKVEYEQVIINKAKIYDRAESSSPIEPEKRMESKEEFVENLGNDDDIPF